MIRFFAGFRSTLALLAIIFFALAGLASAQTPPPAKVEQLIEILSDPAVKAWLDQQLKLQQPAAAVPPGGMQATSFLSTGLAMIKSHSRELIDAFPRLPAQFERARMILLLEFEEQGLLGILVLILGLVAAGFGFDKLLRSRLGSYRDWMKSIPTTNPAGRLKGLGARLLYASILIAAFTIGSAGVFLLFEWPLLLREIVLAYLSVAIITRIAMMMCRVLFMPPFLALPHAAKYRVVEMSDARSAHWYRFVGLNVGWFTFVGATLSLMDTFGFDQPGRLAIGVVAGFIQLLLVLAAVWLRPANAPETTYRVSPKATTWLLTAFFITLWLLRVSGSYTAFWLLLALVALPATILAAKAAVHHVLRAPEDDSEPFPHVAIAVIDRGLRVCLIIAAAYFLARVWGLDVIGMTQGDSVAERFLRGGLNAAVIILAADFGWSVTKAIISRKLGDSTPGPAEEGHSTAVTPQQARMRTLLPIFQNILFALILVMAILMTLSSIGIEIAPLIAGAGVFGVAIGFGAQTIVKDVISGMFYLLDDAFRVGEYVESGNYRGTVESFSLRSVKLRHHRGYLSTVPFGELGAVQNMSRDWVIDKFSITVGYDTDLEAARKLIKKLGIELAADPEFAPHVIEPLKMQGVQNFGDYGIEIRMKMMTKPGEQFPIRRKAYVRLKQLFKDNGIEIPFPTVHVQGTGESGEGTAAAQSFIADKADKAALAASPGPAS